MPPRLALLIAVFCESKLNDPGKARLPSRRGAPPSFAAERSFDRHPKRKIEDEFEFDYERGGRVGMPPRPALLIAVFSESKLNDPGKARLPSRRGAPPSFAAERSFDRPPEEKSSRTRTSSITSGGQERHPFESGFHSDRSVRRVCS